MAAYAGERMTQTPDWTESEGGRVWVLACRGGRWLEKKGGMGNCGSNEHNGCIEGGAVLLEYIRTVPQRTKAALRTELQRTSQREIEPVSHLTAHHAIGPVPSLHRAVHRVIEPTRSRRSTALSKFHTTVTIVRGASRGAVMANAAGRPLVQDALNTRVYSHCAPTDQSRTAY